MKTLLEIYSQLAQRVRILKIMLLFYISKNFNSTAVEQANCSWFIYYHWGNAIIIKSYRNIRIYF